MTLLFCQALGGLLAFDMLRLNSRFAALHRLVRAWNVRHHVLRRESVETICAQVNLACIWYPKRVLCLQRSAVTTCLLRSHGIPAQMILGAQKLPFKAHAWVEVNGQAVNEQRDVRSMFNVWESC
jgi:hypothetical protein